jgi:hypothetical protein
LSFGGRPDALRPQYSVVIFGIASATAWSTADHLTPANQQPIGHPLAVRVAEIDLWLDSTPGRIRFRPLLRAIFRALVLTVPELHFLLSCPPPNLGPLDLMALQLVGRAAQGDLKAVRRLFDLIEGRPRRRRATRADADDGLTEDQVERIVRHLNERLGASGAG